MKWQNDDFRRAVDALRASGSVTIAARRCGVSPAAMKDAFRRAGKLNPGSYTKRIVNRKLPGDFVQELETEHRAKVSKRTLTYVVVSDVHVPFQDKPANAAICALLKDVRPDGLIVNGDFLDLIEVSTHAAGSVAQLEGQRISTTFREGNKLLDSYQAAAGKQCLDNHFVEGNHECLSDDTEALTKRGWLPYTEISTEDEVLSFDTKTQEAVWKKVLAVKEYDFEGKMANLVSNRLDFLLTPNHRVLLQDVQSRRWDFIPVSDIPNTSTRLAVPISGKNSRPDFPGVSLAELRLFGWILTDGWLVNGSTFGISQRVSKANQVRKALDEAGVPYHEKTRHRDITEIAGKTLKKKCEGEVSFSISVNYGRTYINKLNGVKEIPAWMHNLSQAQFNALLEGMLGGNGTKIKGGAAWVYYCSNENRGKDLQALAVQNGWACSMSEYRPGHFRVNLVPSKLTTQLCSSLGARAQDTHFIPTPYTGKVWCLSVADLENFCIRRNGKVCFTGNSRLSRWMQSGDNAVWLGDEATSISQRLHLDDRSFVYHPNYPEGYVKLGHLIVTHGKWCGKYAAAVHLDRYRHSVLIGHVHTPQAFYGSGFEKQQAGFSTGHLADESSPALAYAPKPNAWRKGAAVVHVDPNGSYHVQLVNFVDGSFYFGGKRYGGSK